MSHLSFEDLVLCNASPEPSAHKSAIRSQAFSVSLELLCVLTSSAALDFALVFLKNSSEIFWSLELFCLRVMRLWVLMNVIRLIGSACLMLLWIGIFLPRPYLSLAFNYNFHREQAFFIKVAISTMQWLIAHLRLSYTLSLISFVYKTNCTKTRRCFIHIHN